MIEHEAPMAQKRTGTACLLEAQLGERRIGPARNHLLAIEQGLAVANKIQVVGHDSSEGQ